MVSNEPESNVKLVWGRWAPLAGSPATIVVGIGATRYTAYGESTFLMFRKDLFEQDGIKVPATMDEMVAAAKTIKCLQLAAGAAYTDDTRKNWTETHKVKLEALLAAEFTLTATQDRVE